MISDALLERVHAVFQRGEGEPVGDVLGLVRTGAEAQLQPAVAHVVDGYRALGQDRRVPEAHAEHQVPDPHVLRLGGQRRHD